MRVCGFTSESRDVSMLLQLKLPSDYPYKPPAIKMCTPSGRFQINKRICMSMSGAS